MKKLYTLALAAACTISAAAVTPHITLNKTPEIKSLVSKNSQLTNSGISLQRVKPVNNDAAETKGYDEATKTWSIEGDYKFVIDDCYFTNGAGVVEINVTAELEEGIVWFTEEAGEYFATDLPAYWDESANTLTFPQVKVGQVGSYYCILSPVTYSQTDKLQFTSSLTATFVPSTGEISFPSTEDTTVGMAWVAFSDANYSNQLGYLSLFDLLSAEQYIPDPIDEEQAGQWKKVGTATITDAWITPSYTLNDSQMIPSDYPFQAELQQSVDNEHLYRVWKPYHSEEFALLEYNTSIYEGQIVFDITDPAHVVVKPGMPAGFKNHNGEFYVFGLLGWQIFRYGDAYKEEYLPKIIEFMEEKGQPFDTYEDGVVSVNRSVFDTKASCSSAYTWNGNEYIVSTIKMALDAVEDLTVIEEAAEAPVYYNLQGVRVSNPVAGQLLIKKQGESVSKVLVK